MIYYHERGENVVKINKVKKGNLYHYNKWGYNVEKYTWYCAECGLEWFSRGEASSCASRSHRPAYNNYYGTQKAMGKMKIKKGVEKNVRKK